MKENELFQHAVLQQLCHQREQVVEVLVSHPVHVERGDAATPDVQQSPVSEHHAALDGADGQASRVRRVHVQVIAVQLTGARVQQATVAVIEAVQTRVEVAVRIYK